MQREWAREGSQGRSGRRFPLPSRGPGRDPRRDPGGTPRRESRRDPQEAAREGPPRPVPPHSRCPLQLPQQAGHPRPPRRHRPDLGTAGEGPGTGMGRAGPAAAPPPGTAPLPGPAHGCPKEGIARSGEKCPHSAPPARGPRCQNPTQACLEAKKIWLLQQTAQNASEEPLKFN